MDAKASNRYMLKTTAVIAVGQICTKAINFFLLPLYTAFISAEVYGTVDLLSTMVTLLVVVVNLQLEQTIFRFVSASRENEGAVGEILSTIYALSFGLCTLFSLILVPLWGLIPYDSAWFLVVGVWGNVYLSTMVNTARGLGHTMTYALSNFVSALTIILLNLLILLVLKLPPIMVLYAYAVGPIVGGTVAVFIERPWRHARPNRISKARAREILAYSIPLVPNELSWWVVHASDRVIVSAFLGTAANGLIAVAGRFTTIYSTVYGIFNLAWVEQCFINYEKDGGKEYLAQTMAKVLKVFACGTLLLVSVMPFLYTVMVNQDYAGGYGIVAPYLLSAFLNVIVGLISPIYLINNETGTVAKTTMVAAAINGVSNLVLVNVIGIYAGPVSSILGYLAVVIQRVPDISRRFMELPLERAFLVRLVLAWVCILACYYANNHLIWITGIIVAISYSWLECKSFARFVVEMVLSRGKLRDENPEMGSRDAKGEENHRDLGGQ